MHAHVQVQAHTKTVQTPFIAMYHLNAVHWLQCYAILAALQLFPSLSQQLNPFSVGDSGVRLPSTQHSSLCSTLIGHHVSESDNLNWYDQCGRQTVYPFIYLFIYFSDSLTK